jgi:hypothetical protein
MPPLIRLFVSQVLVGFGLAAVLVALMLWFNIANLGYLVQHSDVGPLAVFLLWAFNGIVLGSVQFAIAVMGMADDDDDDQDGGHPAHEPIPIPVRRGR